MEKGTIKKETGYFFLTPLPEEERDEELRLEDRLDLEPEDRLTLEEELLPLRDEDTLDEEPELFRPRVIPAQLGTDSALFGVTR